MAIALLRLAELIHANRNTTRLIARGGVEFGRKHYPLFVLLHGSWLASLLLVVPAEAKGSIALLVIFVMLQFCRLWVIVSLGPYWTTRVISGPDFPVVTRSVSDYEAPQLRRGLRRDRSSPPHLWCLGTCHALQRPQCRPPLLADQNRNCGDCRAPQRYVRHCVLNPAKRL